MPKDATGFEELMPSGPLEKGGNYEVSDESAIHPSKVDVVHAQTGTPLRLDPKDAAEAFMAGTVNLVKSGSYHVAMPDGEVTEVPAEGVSLALNKGGGLISAADARRHELHEKYGGALGTGLAAGMGLASGATGGVSDEILDMVGEDTAGAAKFIQEANPITTGLAQAGGALLTAKVPGLGFGEAAEGLMGELAGTEATSFAGKLAQKGLAQAARQSVEAAQMAHVALVSEDALNGGDHQLTAEKYFADIGKAALYGAAGGALFGAGGELVKPGLKAVGHVAEGAFGYVPKGLKDAWSGAKSFLSMEEDQAAAARNITDHVNTMVTDARDLAEEAKGAMKRGHLSESVSKDDPVGVAVHSSDTIGGVRNTIRSMLEKSDEFGQERLLGRMDKELGRIEKAIAYAGEKGSNAEQFGLLDDAKRAIGSWTRDVRATSLRSSTDPISLRQARATYDKLDEMYEGLRKNLEQEDVWGKAGNDQKQINAAWSRQIAADKQFRSTLAAVVGEERFGGKIYAADPAKIDRYVQGLVNPHQDLIHKTIKDYVGATKDLTKAIGDAFDLAPEQAAKVARVGKAAEAFDKTVTDAADKLATANQFKASLAAEGQGPGALAHGAILGAVAGHPLGGALGLAADVALRPSHTMLRLAKLAQTAEKIDAKLGGAVSRFFRRGEEAQQAGAARAGGKALQASEQGAARESYQKRAKSFAKDTVEAVMARVSAHVAELQSEAPKTAHALAQVSARAHQYLESKLPATPPPDPITGRTSLPPKSEIDRFNRIAKTIEDPTSAADDLAKGRLTWEQADALKNVYPKVYNQLATDAASRLAKYGGELTYQQRVQLATLLGVGADPSMLPDAMKHAQATLTTPPAPPPKPAAGGKGKPMALSKDSKTQTETLEGGASAA